MGIELNPIYKAIPKTDKRYIVVTGGRNSSKSFSLNTIACLTTYEPNHRILFTRYTMTSARISIIPEFEEKINLLEVPNHFKVLQNSVENTTTGSDIIFKGIKAGSKAQTANLKSIHGVSMWVLDESEELKDEDTFDTIDLSVRNPKVDNKIILILNPTTQDHWIWRRWFEGHTAYHEIDGFKIPISTHPDILHIHTTYLDNIEHIPKTYLEQILKLKERNPKKYQHKILGGWLEKAEGVIYENWETGAFDESLPYCYGLDFGFYPDPLAMIKLAVNKRSKKIYIKQCIYATNLSNNDVIQSVKGALQKRQDVVVCDTNEPRTRIELTKNGVRCEKAYKPKNSIINGIRAIQDYHIVVTEDSQDIIKELNNYAWNDRKADIPIDDHNHALDAMRYAFDKLTRSSKKGVRRRN